MLDVIILKFLSSTSMHGYQIITQLRQDFGVYFGPSTIYPLLCTLEKRGFICSEWNMDCERPKKIYHLTADGQSVLAFAVESLTFICKR